MPLARDSNRGLALNCRLAVNGIQNGNMSGPTAEPGTCSLGVLMGVLTTRGRTPEKDIYQKKFNTTADF